MRYDFDVQVECVSSTIRNTHRAQQMSQRVLHSLAHVDHRPPPASSGDQEVWYLQQTWHKMESHCRLVLPAVDGERKSWL